MNLPSFPHEMFAPGAVGAMFTALVFCAALYLFHKKDPARGTRVDRFHVPLLILSLLLTALFLFPSTVRAAVLIEGLYYELEDADMTATVVGPKDETIEHASIPETVTIEGTEYRVTTIGDRAFEYCIELKSVNIPAGITSIGDQAFEDCSSLTSVSIPSGVKSIEDNAFKKCSSLTSVSIPSGVTSIGTNAFASCTLLQSVIFDGVSNLKSIGPKAFENCFSLTSVSIPAGVTSIGISAFDNCSSLKSVTISSTVTSIGKFAFGDCSSLTSVTIQRGTEPLSLGQDVFCGIVTSAVKIEFPEGSAWDFEITPDAGFGKDGNSLTLTDNEKRTDDAVLTPYPVNSITDGPAPEGSGPIPPCGSCRLPATGFSSLRPSALSEQPESLRYTPAGMRLMIPSLDVDSELVTVPLNGDTWAVEWLGDRSGILEGSALPGQGISMVAAHNSLNDMETGPFALLSLLEPNDVIAVSGNRNDLKVFRVFANELLAPDDMKTVAAIAAREADTLVLITCENESAEGGYLNRRVVFAK